MYNDTQFSPQSLPDKRSAVSSRHYLYHGSKLALQIAEPTFEASAQFRTQLLRARTLLYIIVNWLCDGAECQYKCEGWPFARRLISHCSLQQWNILSVEITVPRVVVTTLVYRDFFVNCFSVTKSFCLFNFINASQTYKNAFATRRTLHYMKINGH